VTPASNPLSEIAPVPASPEQRDREQTSETQFQPTLHTQLLTPLEMSRKLPTRGWLAPGLTAHLNLYFDLLILASVLVLGQHITGDQPRAIILGELMPLVVTAVVVWVVSSSTTSP
jgi:hypothetical protein